MTKPRNRRGRKYYKKCVDRFARRFGPTGAIQFTGPHRKRRRKAPLAVSWCPLNYEIIVQPIVETMNAALRRLYFGI